MAVNSFDVADRLPPLPRGTYDMSCGEVSAEHWDQEWSQLDPQTRQDMESSWGAPEPKQSRSSASHEEPNQMDTSQNDGMDLNNLTLDVEGFGGIIPEMGSSSCSKHERRSLV